MSYIRAKVVEQDDEVKDDPTIFGLQDIDMSERPDLDMNLDDEILDFVLALIAKVNDLGEGKALVVWKEIF